MEYKGSLGIYKLDEQPMKAGGEGSIYAISNREDMVAKIYHREKLSDELEEKIVYMTNNPPDEAIMNQIAWPQDVLRNSANEFVGFVMPRLSIDTDLKAIYAYPPSKKIQITYEQKVIVAINICIVISAIHKARYVFGDFNPLNIGINLKTGHVAFLDTDSYHITNSATGDVYRCTVCLDGYAAPELIQHCKGTDFASAPLPTFTHETDRFALAIHVFKLLMNGYTPFNGIKEGESASQASPGVGNLAIERDNYCFKPGNKPQSVATPDISSLTPDLQYLFKKTFLGGANTPSQRTTADEWYQALCEYKDNLTKCAKDPTHYYYINNSTCPYCDADKRYNQSMSHTTSSYKTNSSGSASQMNFGTPVNVPQSNQANNSQKQNNKSVIKRILLWFFFFPIMLCIKIAKSRMGLVAKIILMALCVSWTLSGIGDVFRDIGGIAEAIFELSDIGGSSITDNDDDIIVQDKFLLEENDTGYTVKLVDGKADKIHGAIVIPSEYNGKQITEIADNGFENCVYVTSFTVPEGVTRIGEAAFKGCNKLESISLPFLGESANAQNQNAVLGYIFGYEDVKKETSYSYNDYATNDRPSDIVGETWQFTYQNGSTRHYYYYYIPESLTEVKITNQTNVPS